MNRYALILTNPGDKAKDNYCQGVNIDRENYVKYLKSPIGGCWTDSEMLVLDKPQKGTVRKIINDTKSYDYTMVVFCGHGYTLANHETCIELNNYEDLNSTEFRSGCSSMSLILDCCRRSATGSLLVESMAKFSDSFSRINAALCEYYYNQAIEKAAHSLVVMYACNIEETAGDSSSTGGYYSSSLIKSAQEWAKRSNRQYSSSAKILDITQAHDLAIPSVLRLSGNRQNPQIEKPRTGPYYPFTVIA